uniref:Uncharacterized protein n=1 Tax=Arundo donax TaxID=35708 RepID=A0A0A9A1L4_ARUDO
MRENTVLSIFPNCKEIYK